MSLFWIVFFLIFSNNVWQLRGILLSKPNQNAILGEPYSLTCDLEYHGWSHMNVSFVVNLRRYAKFCSLYSTTYSQCIYSSFGCTDGFRFTCDTENGIVIVRIHETSITFHGVGWNCIDDIRHVLSNEVKFNVDVPISAVNITATNENTSVTQMEYSNTLRLTCNTDEGQPPPWIHWFIGEQNITSLAKTQIHSKMYSSKYVATSTLVYRGIEADHFKTIYCEAGNIKGRTITSAKHVYIHSYQPINESNKIPTIPFHIGVAVGAGAMLFVCNLVGLIVCLTKRNSKEKMKEYEEPSRVTSDQNQYNELNGIPRVIQQSPDENTRSSYEEVL